MNQLITGGPASGKTTELVKRIKLAVQDGVDPARILVLSRSKPSRIQAKVEEAVGPGIEFHSIHDFALSLSDVWFIDADAVNYITDLLCRARGISAYKDVIKVKQAVQLGRPSDSMQEEIYKQHVTIRQRYGLETYNGLVKNAVGKVTNVDWVFVDGLEDLTSQEWDFVKSIGAPITAAGDKSQAVYSFAGADLSSFNEFESVHLESKDVFANVVPQLTPHVTSSGELKHLVKSLHSSNAAILGRSRASLELFASALEKQGVGFQTQTINGQLLSVLRYIYDRNPIQAILAMRMQPHTIPKEDIPKLLDGDLSRLTQSEELYTLNHLDWNSPRVQQFGGKGVLAKEQATNFINWTQSFQSLSQFIHSYWKHAVPSDPNKVHLSTVHNAKGLFWKHVYIPFANDTEYPHRLSHNSEAGRQEEERLWNIAISRAAPFLYCSYATTTDLTQWPQPRQLSRFVRQDYHKFHHGTQGSMRVSSKMSHMRHLYPLVYTNPVKSVSGEFRKLFTPKTKLKR